MGKIINNKKGFVVLLNAILFVSILLAILFGISRPILAQYSSVQGFAQSKQSYLVAHSAVEDIFYRLKTGKNFPSSSTLTLSSGSATVSTLNSSGKRSITVNADTNDYQRNIKMDIGIGAGIDFNYGLQAGNGGMIINGESAIDGNVYSNSNINAISAVITGSAIAADTSYIGGATYVGGVRIGTAGVGDAWAANVRGARVEGNLYCTTGLNNNKSCNTSRGNPPPQPMPFSEEDIQSWKDEAAAGNTIGGITIGWAGGILGPTKITGNLVVNGGGTLTLNGPLWVEGNVTITNGGKVILPENYGENSETIVADGTITVSGGGSAGSGEDGSYLFMVSTSKCPDDTNCSGKSAINITGGAGAIAANAQKGNVALSGGADINAVVGNSITVSGGSTVTYDEGLASPSFQSGPSGGYIILDWNEI